MVGYRFLAMAGLAASVPLNINLGAYSPALVVGDGEISFGGREDVSNLMNALEGAAVNAAAGAAEGTAAAGTTAAAAQAPATANQAAVAVSESTPAATDPALSQQAQQIAALQGMGKAIAPRIGAVSIPAVSSPAKRDLAGFDRALKYAEVALQKGPNIQLGTGEGGSGVGITVDNTPTTAATNAGVVVTRKRNIEGSSPARQRRAKVTTMYVRRGVPASLDGAFGEIATRDAVAAPAVSAADVLTAPPSKRNAIDAVNLNVSGDQGVTMTFVETVDSGEDGEEAD